ncbi:MAG: type II secretion system major pseudopilin GspG [Patescibacteria group bacterium]|nr:type II secretion system major pseudopilin GspG [Patescibacteria group bacterium]
MRPPTKTRRRPAHRGFTLIEVLLVLTILVIIGSIAVVAIVPMQRNAYIRAAEAQVKAFKTPLQAYRIDIGTYPNSSQGLEALRNPPSDLTSPTKWRGPYLETPVPADPWSNPYRYEYPGKFQEDWPDIWSYGPDGIDGTDDDIGNWIVAE